MQPHLYFATLKRNGAANLIVVLVNIANSSSTRFGQRMKLDFCNLQTIASIHRKRAAFPVCACIAMVFRVFLCVGYGAYTHIRLTSVDVRICSREWKIHWDSVVVKFMDLSMI